MQYLQLCGTRLDQILHISALIKSAADIRFFVGLALIESEKEIGYLRDYEPKNTDAVDGYLCGFGADRI